MAAEPGIPKPGTSLGPCEGICKHIDCASKRLLAAALCRYCRRLIGFDRAFYRVSDPEGPEYVHRDCLLREAERLAARERRE